MTDPASAPAPPDAGGPLLPPAPAPPAPAGDPVFWPRALSPLLVLAGAIVLAILTAGIATAAGASEDAAGSLAVAAASGGILLFAALVVRGMRPLDRRLILGRKGSVRAAVGIGVLAGFGALVASGIILSVGSALDPGSGDKLERVGRDLQDSTGAARWQDVVLVVSLVVLAPLGEELLFRGVLLRTLARRMSFWSSAVVGSCAFALAHLDQYDPYPIWPRTLSLAVIGVILCRVYRSRGYLGSVVAHATVNAVAAVAILAT